MYTYCRCYCCAMSLSLRKMLWMFKVYNSSFVVYIMLAARCIYNHCKVTVHWSIYKIKWIIMGITDTQCYQSTIIIIINLLLFSLPYSSPYYLTLMSSVQGQVWSSIHVFGRDASKRLQSQTSNTIIATFIKTLKKCDF